MSLLAAAPFPLLAQLAPLIAPKGVLRIDIGGRFENWDKRYFNGTKQEAAGDFIVDPADGHWLPGLALTEAEIKRITGAQAISLSLGKTSASMLVNLGTASFGAAFGITRRLTIFGTVPLVRVRVQQKFSVDSASATAGFNPGGPFFGNIEAAALNDQFLGLFHAALVNITNAIQSGQYDSDPAKKVLAQATLARGTALQADLQAFFGTSHFIPLAGTPAAGAILGSIDSIRTRYTSDLGLVGFTAVPFFPAAGIPGGGLEDYATKPGAGVEAQPFTPPVMTYIGDIEVGAAYAWLDRRPDRGGVGFRSVLQGTVRLRTGKLDRPDSFFDVGTGERQPDLQGDLVTDLIGGRIGARFTARYVLQLPGRQQRRLTPPDQAFALANTLAAVERDPGEIVEAAFEPYLRMAPSFALTAGIRHWSKAEDKFKYTADQGPIEGTSPDVLAQGTKENGTVFSAGLSFAQNGVRARDGKAVLPMDASLRFEQVVGSRLGRVPVRQSVSFVLRLYGRVFK